MKLKFKTIILGFIFILGISGISESDFIPFANHSLIARKIRGSNDIEVVAKEFVEEFGISSEEAKGYVKTLWKAAQENEEDFHYCSEQIKQLGSSKTLKQVISCVGVLKDKAKIKLVFDLMESLKKQSPKPYYSQSILEDIATLSKKKAFKDIKHGFKLLLDMLIKVTDYSEKEADEPPEAYLFLRPFTQGVIIEKKWREYEYVKKNFSFCMEKILEVIAKGKEENAWEALYQINILFDIAQGDRDKFNELYRNRYKIK